MKKYQTHLLVKCEIYINNTWLMLQKNIKQAEHWRIDDFQIVVLEKTLETPLDCKEIKPLILREINPECLLEGLMLKL